MRRRYAFFLVFLLFVFGGIYRIMYPYSAAGIQKGLEDMPHAILKNKQALLTIIEENAGQYIGQSDAMLRRFALYFPLPLCSVDLRNAKQVSFRLWDSVPEGSRYVYYCPEDRYQISSEKTASPTDPEGRIVNLGINGEGYLYYKRMLPCWYYVESFLPT